MSRHTPRRIVLVGIVALAVLGLGAGTVLASANNKKPDYDSNAEASGGIDLLGLAAIGQSESSSTTEKKDDGAGAQGSATALDVPGVATVGEAQCSTAGTDRAGADIDEDSDALLEVAVDPVSVRVLGASCRARAVQSNNASATTEASVLDASVGELSHVRVLGSESESTTTSGQARSSNASTVASVNGFNVLGCESEASENRGGSQERSSAVVFGTATGEPCDDLFHSSSEASHEQTNPSD